MQRPPQNRLVAIPGYRPNLSRNESRNHGRELSSVPTTNNEKEKEKEELFGLGWTENSHADDDYTYNLAIKVEDKDNCVSKIKSEQPIICLIDNTDLNKIFFSNTTGINSGINKINVPPPYYDQGSLGSCTANAICFLYQYELLKKKLDFGNDSSGKKKSTAPSRLFLYYYERFLEGNADKFEKKYEAAKLSDGIEALKTYGVCSETDWAYYADIKKVTKPSDDAIKLAAEHKIKRDVELKQIIFHALHISDVKHILENGDPVAFGFTMYSNFQPYFTKLKYKGPFSKEKYVMPNPDSSEKYGGHAVVMVGFDDEIEFDDGDGSGGKGKGAFLIRNSWGEDWGLKGHFYMPYRFVFETDNNGDYCLGKLSKQIAAGEFWAITDIPPPPT